MKALILSDSHRCLHAMEQAMAMHRDADCFIFLGDGLTDFQSAALYYPAVASLFVRGNCDFLADAPEEDVFTLGSARILYLHGHTRGVKGGLGGAIAEAYRKEADILLFGHTHVPYASYDAAGRRPLHIFNPGSIGMTYGGKRHFGVLEVRENGILLSHGKI